MSRRQRTLLVLSVRIPVPAGWTQKDTIEQVAAVLQGRSTVFPAALSTNEVQVRLERRETTYL